MVIICVCRNSGRLASVGLSNTFDKLAAISCVFGKFLGSVINGFIVKVLCCVAFAIFPIL